MHVFDYFVTILLLIKFIHSTEKHAVSQSVFESYIIAPSWSEPHINHSYEKITVLMHICMHVCMSQYIVHVINTHARARKLIGKDCQCWLHANSKYSSLNHWIPYRLFEAQADLEETRKRRSTTLALTQSMHASRTRLQSEGSWQYTLLAESAYGGDNLHM